MTIWYILNSFGTFFSSFGIMYQEKSGNPDQKLLTELLVVFVIKKCSVTWCKVARCKI
jgi:hypothetical protein